MTYYSALWTDDYWGYTDIGMHSTKQNAIASLRRKMVRSTAEAGVIFDARPPANADDDDWVRKHEIGIIDALVRVKNGRPITVYVYAPRQKYGRHNVKYLVRSDGTLIPY